MSYFYSQHSGACPCGSFSAAAALDCVFLQDQSGGDVSSSELPVAHD